MNLHMVCVSQHHLISPLIVFYVFMYSRRSEASFSIDKMAFRPVFTAPIDFYHHFGGVAGIQYGTSVFTLHVAYSRSTNLSLHLYIVVPISGIVSIFYY
jgi:hypothetical protein